MAASSVVYYGIDDVFCIPVLQYAGCDVADCNTLPDLTRLLASLEADAVVFAQEPDDSLLNAARSLSDAPLVCFASDLAAEKDRQFDLVIEPCTSPKEWVASVQQLLQQSRAVRAKSALLRASSASLREESAVVRAETRNLIRSIRRSE